MLNTVKLGTLLSKCVETVLLRAPVHLNNQDSCDMWQLLINTIEAVLTNVVTERGAHGANAFT